jgi:hypothetical protein
MEDVMESLPVDFSAQPQETELAVGPRSIEAYSRLSYTMWYALAEFIDNSTQSRTNYGAIIDDVLRNQGQPLTVEIVHDRIKRQIAIRDNSIGMRVADLIEALKVAHPTKNSRMLDRSAVAGYYLRMGQRRRVDSRRRCAWHRA